MTFKRVVAAVFALAVGLVLGACSSSADFVSDHWPHFAGGEPNDVPPRPGTPGYANFIAHGQPAENAPAAGTQPSAPGQTAAVGGQQPLSTNPQSSAFTQSAPQYQKPAATPAPAAVQPSSNQGTVQSGLY
jgi:hypothetical protein